MVDVVVDDIVPAVDVEVASRAGGINKVVHDETLVGDGVKEPLGVNPDTIPDVSGFATKDELAGKADKSEIPTVPTKVSEFENDAGYLTEHQDISGKQDKLTAGENITIVDNVISATGGGSGDYLPLSGGTLTGPIVIDSIDRPQMRIKNDVYTWEFRVSSSGLHLYKGIGDNTSHLLSFGYSGSIWPTSIFQSLGLSDSTFKKLYVKTLNSGGDGVDLIVPTEGGTLARIEDIDAIGGDGTTGQVLTKTDTGMAWTTVSGGGGSGGASLPDQTGNAGKFLTTDGATASWGDAIANTAKYPEYQIAIGGTTTSGTTGNIVIGHGSSSSQAFSIAIGPNCKVSAEGGILLNARGVATHVISQYAELKENYSFYVGLGSTTNGGMYKMLGADGLIPVERLKLVTDQIGDISTALTAILGE